MQPEVELLRRVRMCEAHKSRSAMLLFEMGDYPEEQGMRAKSLRWSDSVRLGLGHNPCDFSEAM